MKNHITKTKTLLTMASIITSMSLTGFTTVQGGLRSTSLSPDENAPKAVTTSTVASDTTAPVIDAQDIVIPYGTSLRPDEMGSVTDDRDGSPKLEILSVLEIKVDNSQNTTIAEGSTPSATASNAATSEFYDTSTAVELVKDTVTESAATNSTAVGTAESATADAAEIAESATTGVAANSAATAITSEAATTAVAAEANTTSAAAEATTTSVAAEATTTAVTTEAATTSATTDKIADTATANSGYMFSKPGQYSVVLKGTDKSGNESTKTITVTVADNIAPVFTGLSEGFTLTDKDKAAPDYLSGITAADEIDGDITAGIKVDDSKVQYGKAGSYNVSYSVSDTSGNAVTATVPVIIKDSTPPALILMKSDFNLFVTDQKPDYAAFVIATDTVDGDVKDTLSVDDSSVKYDQSGEYTATIRAEDKSGNAAEKTVKVNVAAGWKTQDGQKYYYSPQDGHMYHSWSHIDDELYYFDPDDGHMLTGLQNIDDRQYLLDSKDGHMVTGWQTISGEKYYFSQDDGHMYHSWSNIEDEEYYFDPAKGHLLTGLLTIDGDQYLMDETDGHQLTGWQTIDSEKYYFSKNDGHMYHDWSTIDGTEYYFDRSDGHMYTGRHYIDGEEYNFGTSGAATKVAQTRSSGNNSDSGSKSISSYSYIGNRNTGKFHRASCSSVSQMNEGNKVGFDSRSEAIESGYDPCKRCKP